MSDRKYRQPGYQDADSGAGEHARRGQPREPAAARRPTGRGLGRHDRSLFRCRDCGQPADPDAIEPESVCQRCGKALHTCVNCGSFDTSSRWECRESIPERVESKVRANACSFFRARQVVEHSDTQRQDDDPRAAFDALFRG